MRRVSAALILAAAVMWISPAAECSVTVDEEEVVFELEAPEASKVFLVGDFNSWNPTMDSMVRREGRWQVRLFLVPGTYRYMFVVDGETVPDPDNPNRDAEGRTYFIFTEENGSYGISYSTRRAGEAGDEEASYGPFGRLFASAFEESGIFAGEAGITGTIEKRIRMEVAAGLEHSFGEDRAVVPFLKRARGTWWSKRLSAGAYYRSGELSFGDPLDLFGEVGPYRYPLGLFCRGFTARVSGPFGTDGEFFFAGRIEGYEPGLESRMWIASGSGSCAYRPQSKRHDGDADMYGIRAGGDAGPVRADYLHKVSLVEGRRLTTGEISSLCTTGYERLQAGGPRFVLAIDGLPVLEAQYLRGVSYFNAYRWVDRSSGFELHCGPSGEWERGDSYHLGVSGTAGPLDYRLSWSRRTIEGVSKVRCPGREGRMDMLGLGASSRAGKFRIELDAEGEWYGGKDSSLRVFRLRRYDFWLDGDRLNARHLPFLDSKRFVEAGLRVVEGGADTISTGYREEGYLALTVSGDFEGEGGSVFEASGGRGILIGGWFGLHADLRYVYYDIEGWTGDRGFLGSWAGVSARVADSGWIGVGLGVAPHRFDIWRFEFDTYGRESYLLESGILELVESPEEDMLPGRLGEAEEDLKDDWRIGLEARFEF